VPTSQREVNLCEPDEVESLTTARAAALSGNEPTDGLRVGGNGNASCKSLRQLGCKCAIDPARQVKNKEERVGSDHFEPVWVDRLVEMRLSVATQADKADSAFIDRADIKEYVGLPPAEAIYWILSSILTELMEKRMIHRTQIPAWNAAGGTSSCTETVMRQQRMGAQLRQVAEQCHVSRFSLLIAL
jgi:hypothetical protein